MESVAKEGFSWEVDGLSVGSADIGPYVAEALNHFISSVSVEASINLSGHHLPSEAGYEDVIGKAGVVVMADKDIYESDPVYIRRVTLEWLFDRLIEKTAAEIENPYGDEREPSEGAIQEARDSVANMLESLAKKYRQEIATELGVSDLKLPIRARNWMRFKGIETVSQLREWSAKDLAAEPNVGAATARSIEKAVEKYGGLKP